MLYQRYANPMELLNGMLEAGNLCRFVGSIIDFVNEDRKEKTRWEYWLHKEWKRSWPEFLQAQNDNQQAAPTQTETLDIVKESMRMMQSFTPDGGGGMNGDIQTAGRDRDRCIEGGQDS